MSDPYGDTTQQPRPALRMIVSTGRAWINVSLGEMRSAAVLDLQGSLDTQANDGSRLTCASGCRLVHLYLDNADIPGAGPYKVDFTLTSISTDSQPASDLAGALRDDSRWQPWTTALDTGGPAVQASASAQPGGLVVSVTDETATAHPGISSADIPDPLPVVPATGLTTDPVLGSPENRVGAGLDAQRQDIRPISAPSFLPRSHRDGVLADLQNVSGLVDLSTVGDAVQPEVWLRAGAPDSIIDSLTKDKIKITSTDTARSTRHALSLAATSGAATTNVVLIAVAGLIGVAVIVATQLIDADRRRVLWTVAGSSRISRRRMSRLVLTEIATPAALGAVIGAATGVLAIWLAGIRLPLFARGSIGPPVNVSVRWPVAGIVLGGALVVVGLVAAAMAAVEARRNRRQS